MPDEKPGTTVESAAPAQGSAPEKETQHGGVAGSVDTSKKQLEDGSAGKAVTGIKFDLFKAREEKRNMASENESLKARLAALEARSEEPKREKNVEAKTNAFDDPEGWTAQVEERITKKVEQRTSELYFQAEAEKNRYGSSIETENWLLSRSHLKQDPNAGKEIYAIIHSKYANTLQVDPKAAGRSAYIDWCESKGIDPDLARHDSSSTAYTGTGVRPSAVGSSGGSGEVTVEQLKAMTPDERKRAVNEGRYKGKVIRV